MFAARGACLILDTWFGCSLGYSVGVMHPAAKMISKKQQIPEGENVLPDDKEDSFVFPP